MKMRDDFAKRKRYNMRKARILFIVGLCIMMFGITGCGTNDKSRKQMFDALKDNGYIEVGNLEYENYTETKYGYMSKVKYYDYPTEYGTYEIGFFKDSKGIDHVHIVFNSDTMEIQNYYKFEKDGNKKFRVSEAYNRSINSYQKDDYGIKSFDCYQNRIYILVDKTVAEENDSPLLEYVEAYASSGELPDVEICLDGKKYSATEVKIDDNWELDIFSIQIDFDVDSFLDFDYVKIGTVVKKANPTE